MTTSVLNFTGTLPQRSTETKPALRPPVFSFGRLLNVLETSMSMMQAVPDNGRINPRQLAKVRALAERI